MKCFSLILVILAFLFCSEDSDINSCQGANTDAVAPDKSVCRSSWGGTLCRGNYVYDDCSYTSSNATRQLNTNAASSLIMSNCRFVNINTRIIYCDSSASLSVASFTNCIFDNIMNFDGGWISLYDVVSSLAVSNCNFTHINSSSSIFFCYLSSSATGNFTNCIFDRIAFKINSVGGGCIALYQSSSSRNTSAPTCTVTSCLFRACKYESPSAANNNRGAAVHLSHILPNITQSRFYSCFAFSGGAIFLNFSSSPSEVNPSNAHIDGNDFAINEATHAGGAVYLQYADNLSFVNNLLCGGSANFGADVFAYGSDDGGLYTITCSRSTPCHVRKSGCVADIPEPLCAEEIKHKVYEVKKK